MSVGVETALSAEDQQEIGALVARYADAVMHADAAQWEATWAADGRWVLGERVLAGRPAIVELWKELIPGYESIVQLVSRGVMRRTPDGVVGRWLLLEIFRRAGAEHDCIQAACYVDRYVQENGAWVFAERNLSVPYRGQLPAGSFVPVPPFPFAAED